ncbi:MAG: stage II sporulation protein E [Tissierellaceae bacterium]|nr:stage II sporulation protein E [Tissierellaceae bacterium]
MIKTDTLINKRDFNSLKYLDKKIILLGLVTFILGRAVVFNNLTPFAYAFLSAFIISEGLSFAILIGALGSIINIHGFGEISYLLANIAVFGFFAFKKDQKEYTQIKAISLGTLIFFGFRILGVIASKNLFFYDVIMIIFESAVVFTASYLFSCKISNISTIMVMALVLAGLKDTAFFSLQIKNVITVFMVLVVAYNQGAFFGGGVGLILGMVSYISHPEMPFILSILGAVGLLSGIFRDLGKTGAILGLLLGNGIISFYINRLGTSFLSLREILLSALFFVFMPKNIGKKINQLFTLEFSIDREYNLKRDEVAIKKINRMADLFYNLGQTFKETAKERDYHYTSEIYGLVDGIANEVCSRCYRYDTCWKGNYYNTYNNFFNLIGLVEAKGIEESTYAATYKFCSRPKEILDMVDRAVERLELNKSWKIKLDENRLLLSEQLKGFGKVMEDIAKDIYGKPSFDEDIEKELLGQLKNSRIDVKSLSVAVTPQKDYDIFVDLNKSVQSVDKIKDTMSSYLGSTVICHSNPKDTQKKQLRFKLIRENRYSAATKVALGLNSENKVSGDSYTYGETENTHYAVISDGMGVGRRAKEESKTAISLLEKLMEADIDKDLALKTINSVLRAKSNGEIFATLDIGFVDLYSGKIQMIKTGAPATFIKKGNKVEVVNSSSLPVGMLEEVDFNVYEGYIGDGDMLIMMSDGVLEAYGSAEVGEEKVREAISRIDSVNPQAMAGAIIKMAKGQGAAAKDDMTVLVTKVWKNI